MKRRTLLKGAGVAAALPAAVALPRSAIAQGQPELRWRLASSYPKSLDTLYGGGAQVAKRVAAMTDNRWQIQASRPARSSAGPRCSTRSRAARSSAATPCPISTSARTRPSPSIPACPSASTPASRSPGCSTGGLALMRDLMRDYGVYPIPAGNTGAQMGGWFRKEINGLEDLKGLKMRIPGIPGQVIARLGVVPQQVAGGDVYPSLERGTIDAEWSGPYDDEKLGFVKIARHYYYPGWWEGGPQVSLYVNLERWNALPESYKAILEAACAETTSWMLAKYDADNPATLRRLVAAGAQVKPFPQDVMEAAYKQAQTLYAELAASNPRFNPRFKTVYEAWSQFRDKETTWFRIAELPFDVFVTQQS